MRKCFIALILFCYAAQLCLGAQVKARPLPEEVKTFEMYSWQDEKGRWTFSVLPAITSAGFSPAVITRKSYALSGVEALKKSIAKLPAGSQIFWLDHTLGIWKDAKGSEQFKYPGPAVVADIRKYCETRQVKVSTE